MKQNMSVEARKKKKHFGLVNIEVIIQTNPKDKLVMQIKHQKNMHVSIEHRKILLSKKLLQESYKLLKEPYSEKLLETYINA